MRMESIACLLKELPSNYEEECYKQKAIVRCRGVSSPANLMMLVMFHLHNGCSLLEIQEVARLTKLGQMSDVAFMNRFEKCNDWFKAINREIAKERVMKYRKPSWMADKRVIAVDASDVREKGRSGRLYRLHYALDIFSMCSIEHHITTGQTGESLTNFKIEKNDLYIADRGYCTIKGMEHVEQSDAQYIIRIRKNSFTLKNIQGEKIDIGAQLTVLGDHEALDLSAYATNQNGQKLPVRICAIRKDSKAIEQSKKKLHRKESKDQITISEETKEFHNYFVVVTNLDCSVSAEEVLKAYRLRWQIEMYFKRLKSILDYGEMPKRRENSVLAWLNGKIMIALLIELVIAKSAFSPREIQQSESLARNEND